MESSMTASRIANSIQQDKTFVGSYLLLEGKKDIKVFRKLICESNSRLKVTFGKYQMRDVYNILSMRGFDRKVAIRDADFLRLNINNKYVEDFKDCIFSTDTHDSEGMIINSSALNDFLCIVSSDQDIVKFEMNFGRIITLIYDLCYPLACLKLANKIYGLGLSFKPAAPDGKKLKYKKFICDKTFKYLGHDKVINTVLEYSTNRGSILSDRKIIMKHLEDTINNNYQALEIVNGHDLAEALFMVCKKGLKSTSKALQDSDCVEEMLCLAYGINYFSNTKLFGALSEWQTANNVTLIKAQAGTI